MKIFGYLAAASFLLLPFRTGETGKAALPAAITYDNAVPVAMSKINGRCLVLYDDPGTGAAVDYFSWADEPGMRRVEAGDGRVRKEAENAEFAARMRDAYKAGINHP